MKMDNLNAFDYAMTLDDISISDTIEINKIVNNNDVDGLTKFLVASSSQQSTNWTSLIRAGLKVNKTNINPKNEKLAEISRFEQYVKIMNKK